MAPKGEPPEALQRCLKWWELDKKAHDDFEKKVNARHDVYEGVVKRNSQAMAWTNKQTPRYAFQVTETIVASLLDPDPKWRLKARPYLTSPEEVEFYRRGVKANELLLSHQADIDNFGEKQRPFSLQGIIAGLTVGKCSWNFEEARRSRYDLVQYPPVTDEWGDELEPAGEEWQDVEKDEVLHDDPTFEVIDVRDFVWQKGAISIDRAARVHHRTDYTFSELKSRECKVANGKMHAGPCEGGIFHSVDELKETDHPSLKRSTLEKQAKEHDSSDFVEVIETWYDHGKRVCLIGNRKVLLSERANPYWHGLFPFVVASSAPGMFKIPGTSEIEVMADLEEMIHSLLNQTLDNLQLINNAIVCYDPSVEDADDLEFYPGARWPINPAMVQMWTPQPISAQIAMPMLEKLKHDMEALPGASAALLGQVDPSTQTATEISTTTTLAMRRVLAKKAQFSMALKHVGEQWIELNQQFVRESRVVQLVGPGGVPAFEEISPEQLQGRYYIDLESMDESMIRAERLAEATSRLQVAAGVIGQFAALKQADPSVQLPNLRAFMDDLLEAGGISDKERYFLAPQAAVAPQQIPGGPPGMAGPPSPNGAAQTAPQANDLNSPSNEFSQSPQAAQQRLAALTGGVANG